MPVGEVERRVTSREVSEWLAYDRLAAQDAEKQLRNQKPWTPPRRSGLDQWWPPEEAAPSGRQWIDLDGPDVFTKLKHRLGMA